MEDILFLILSFLSFLPSNHSSTYSFLYLTHPPIYPSTNPPTHLSIYPFNFIYVLIHLPDPSTHLLIQLPIYPCSDPSSTPDLTTKGNEESVAFWQAIYRNSEGENKASQITHVSFLRIFEKDFLMRRGGRNKVKGSGHWRVQLNRFDKSGCGWGAPQI